MRESNQLVFQSKHSGILNFSPVFMPNQDLIWKKAQTWLPFVSKVLRPLLQRNAIKKIRAHDSSDFYADDSEWLKLLGRPLTIRVDSAVRRLATALALMRMRTYHGCRPKDVRTYFKNGLRIHSHNLLKAQIHELIADGALLERILTNRQELFIDEQRDGKLYVVADDRHLIEFAGHYMIYGSEWLSAVLLHHRDRLLQFGTPTVLEISLPLARVDRQTRIELARHMLTEWVRQPVQFDQVINLDFTFMFKEDLPPELIGSHFHPQEIPNWLERMGPPYRVDSSQCELCKLQKTASSTRSRARNGVTIQAAQKAARIQSDNHRGKSSP
jgi:hypothetical protein